MDLLSNKIKLNKNSKSPLFQQIADQIMQLILEGILTKGQKLPSQRLLAIGLGLNRQTVVAAFDELLAQGWIESVVGKGSFVSENLPIVKTKKIGNTINRENKKAGFGYYKKPEIYSKVLQASDLLHLDDGFPDARLAPVEELASEYRRFITSQNKYTKLGYGNIFGSQYLRNELCTYLKQTRGLELEPENILLTRGTMMAMYLACSVVLKPGDTAMLGDLNWKSAEYNMVNVGAKIEYLKYDLSGPDLNYLEQICKKGQLKFLYLTPHHHYPTTISIKADHRLHILQLAQQYGFMIFEDDYDYDFHYQNKPILPMASIDSGGHVLYCGAFTKSLSPAFRVGYIAGPADIIAEMAHRRRLIDRQGDQILEGVIGNLIHNGVIQRFLKKANKTYYQRMDYFGGELNLHFNKWINYQKPEGGLAIWAGFNKNINLKILAETAHKKGLFFSDGQHHNQTTAYTNYTRLGFASSTTEELERGLNILEDLLKKY